ncbi:MAG: cell division protein FtsZ, partial [Alphaproteobacteria bacterium]|nr:cell division protein FtsZ [Alphaproteobacteria bacterium]
MTINLKAPELRELKPRIMVCGVGGAGGNAVNNMIASGLQGVDFIVANTDAQALTASRADRIIQMGLQVTEGLGAGSQPEVGRAAAEEAIEEIRDHLAGAHMCFVTAGMGGGTGTGAAPVVARTAREMGILTVGVVTKPFQFEGARRMRIAESGISELHQSVDTLIIIPNQNLFRVANERTTFADAFAMADQVLYSGVACITDLMVKEGLINLDFADVRAVMREMGKAMMGTGEASGDRRAVLAAEAAIANPLLDETSMRGARGLLISITGGNDLTLYEVDEAASRIRQEVDEDANIILGATFDQSLDGIVRVSVVATGIDREADAQAFNAAETRIAEAAQRLRAQAAVAQHQSQARVQQAVTTVAMAPQAAVQAVVESAPVQHAPEPVSAPVEAAAPAHYYQPAAQHEEVTLQPVAMKPVMAAPAPQPVQSPAPAAAEPAPGPFIPQIAERPVRAPRMPSVEDLPLPGRNQILAQRQDAPRQDAHGEAASADSKRRSLLDRLASFGIGRESDQTRAQAGPLVQPVRPVPVAAPAPVQSAPQRPHAPMQPTPVH